jgi:hypothetical protein
MKKQVTNNRSSVLRNIITPAAFACALVVSTFTSSVYANDKKEVVSASSVNVKYLGDIDKQPVIQIEVKNKNHEELYLSLRDENGYNLYTTKLTGELFSKKFQFSDHELNDMNVTLIVSTRKGKNAQVYQINNVSTVVEDVVITKVY